MASCLTLLVFLRSSSARLLLLQFARSTSTLTLVSHSPLLFVRYSTTNQVSSRIFTVPNILSFFRLALVPVFLVLVIEGYDVLALIVLIVSSATDYLDGVLAPSMTEGKSLMNAIADMNALLDPLGLKYESYLQNLGRELFYIVAASYLTIYLAIIFLVVANTIIGVQFLMGQQKAARRYRTLVRLGAEHGTLCRAAKTQINWYFGLPVGVAAVSSLFGVRALFSGILSGSAQSGMAEMMIAAGAMILLLCVVEWLYMAAVKRSSSRYLLGLMAPEREE